VPADLRFDLGFQAIHQMKCPVGMKRSIEQGTEAPEVIVPNIFIFHDLPEDYRYPGPVVIKRSFQVVQIGIHAGIHRKTETVPVIHIKHHPPPLSPCMSRTPYLGVLIRPVGICTIDLKYIIIQIILHIHLCLKILHILLHGQVRILNEVHHGSIMHCIPLQDLNRRFCLVFQQINAVLVNIPIVLYIEFIHLLTHVHQCQKSAVLIDYRRLVSLVFQVQGLHGK